MLARGRSLGYVHAFLEAVRIRGVYCDKFRPSAVTINNWQVIAPFQCWWNLMFMSISIRADLDISTVLPLALFLISVTFHWLPSLSPSTQTWIPWVALIYKAKKKYPDSQLLHEYQKWMYPECKFRLGSTNPISPPKYILQRLFVHFPEIQFSISHQIQWISPSLNQIRIFVIQIPSQIWKLITEFNTRRYLDWLHSEP